MYKYLLFLATVIISSCSNSGTAIPKFNLETLDGNVLSSEDLNGKATVLVVWATWCSDCIREIPELNQLAEKYKNNENVKFIAFSDEDADTVRKSLERFPFNFIHIPNSKAYSDKLKSGLTKHFPQVMVLNKDLKPVFDVTENKEPIFSVLVKHINEIIE